MELAQPLPWTIHGLTADVPEDSRLPLDKYPFLCLHYKDEYIVIAFDDFYQMALGFQDVLKQQTEYLTTLKKA